jgi:hypothetical protein
MQGRVGTPSLTHLRGNAATSSVSSRRFAAENWDAKGLAIPTLGYEDAASRLKFGSCEDDEPSQDSNRTTAYARVGAPSLTHFRSNAAIASRRNAAFLQLGALRGNSR